MRYFLDTEFNGHEGELISLALVSESGKELYMACACWKPVPWVAENVMPIVACEGALPLVTMPDRFGGHIASFLRDDTLPFIISDWPSDIAHFCRAMIVGPGQMVDVRSIAFEVMRVDAYPTTLPGAVQHNALWDARALRHKVMAQSPASAV